MDREIGLLWLRVCTGSLMLFGHGWQKLFNFTALSASFPDPLGIGPFLGLILAIFAEFFCSILIILGIKTRWAAIPLFITMLVAFLIIHSQDPWNRKELAAVYGVIFFSLILLGGGKYSLDGLWGGRRGKGRNM